MTERPEEGGAGRTRWADLGEDQPVQLRHADRAPALGDRSDRTDQGEQSDALGHRCGGGDRVGTAARDADQGKTPQPDGIGEPAQVVGGLHKTVLAAKIGEPVAGALGREDAQAPIARGLVGEREHEARARRAVKSEHARTSRIAILGVADAPAVGEAHGPGGSVGRHRLRGSHICVHDCRLGPACATTKP